ncbi:hypothetical protein ACHAW6_010068, partial [Cyclotella cf. meneghiniana]
SPQKVLKRIWRYLKATRDKGLILKPSCQLKAESYPDADFAGLYGYELSSGPQPVLRVEHVS